MMITKRFWGLGGTLALLALIAPNAFGQEGLNPRVTIFGAGASFKSDRTFVVGTDPFRSNFAKGGRLGFRGTVDVGRHWAVEGTYSFGTDNLRMFELAQVPPRERAFGVRSHQIGANTLYFIDVKSLHGILPYANVGLGVIRYAPTSAAKAIAATQKFVDEPAVISTTSKVDLNFGGGVQAKASKWLAVRFDFLDHVTGIPRFGVPQTAPATNPGADFYPVSGSIHNFETSVGLVVYMKH